MSHTLDVSIIIVSSAWLPRVCYSFSSTLSAHLNVYKIFQHFLFWLKVCGKSSSTSSEPSFWLKMCRKFSNASSDLFDLKCVRNFPALQVTPVLMCRKSSGTFSDPLFKWSLEVSEISCTLSQKKWSLEVLENSYTFKVKKEVTWSAGRFPTHLKSKRGVTGSAGNFLHMKSMKCRMISYTF